MNTWYGWLKLWQISLSAFRISPHRWYKPVGTWMLNAFQCVAARMLANQSHCTCTYTMKERNHKIDIYKQAISAVYTARKKRANFTQQRNGNQFSLADHAWWSSAVQNFSAFCILLPCDHVWQLIRQVKLVRRYLNWNRFKLMIAV